MLDPACGSGNFLYVAYQELKRLEKLLIDQIAAKKRSPSGQMAMGYVTPLQFFGMDTNPFAVQLARVTMMIGRKIAIDKLGLTENALPLDTLDNNIVCKDALFSEWERADAIIGNPPFLGGHRMRKELGDKYAERIFEKFSEVENQQVDIAAYWFRLAHNCLNDKGRAGLVATNSICQGKGRATALDYIYKNGGYIHEAISSQKWSGEAQVHVSIVNWAKEKPKEYRLDNHRVTTINSSLKPTVDVSKAIRLKANQNLSFRGVEPHGIGFLISEEQRGTWIKRNSENSQVIKLFSMGANLAQNPHGKPDRWIIDFNGMSLEEATDFKLPFEHVRQTVKPARDNNRRDTRRINWWRYGENAPKMRRTLAPLSQFFAVPRVSKWFIFIPAFSNWLPGDLNTVVASCDFYILGVLNSIIHRSWVSVQGSSLGETKRYTHQSCFETFPFPQSPSKKLIEQIRAAAQDLHKYRTEQMEKKQWGITQLYNQFFHEPSSQLFKLHAKLDQLVMQAYGFNSDDDILAKLLELNLELAEKEKRGEAIVGPWSPEE